MLVQDAVSTAIFFHWDNREIRLYLRLDMYRPFWSWNFLESTLISPDKDLRYRLGDLQQPLIVVSSLVSPYLRYLGIEPIVGVVKELTSGQQASAR